MHDIATEIAALDGMATGELAERYGELHRQPCRTHCHAATVRGKPQVFIVRRTACSTSTSDAPSCRARRAWLCVAVINPAPMEIPSLINSQVFRSSGPFLSTIRAIASWESAMSGNLFVNR